MARASDPPNEAKRYPLLRSGLGWTEVTDPYWTGKADAYREVCTDPACPSDYPVGDAGDAPEHSHIVDPEGNRL